LKKWLVAIVFSVLLLVPGGVLDAFGGAAEIPVSIVFMGKKDNCKIFKINKGESPGSQDLLIKAVRVDIISGTLRSIPTIVPDATTIGSSNFVEFTYIPANGQTPQAMATLTVCPASNQLVFDITVVTDPKVEIGKLGVHEHLVDGGQVNLFEFTSQFLIPKKLPTDPKECAKKVLHVGSTNVVQGTLEISCEGKSGGNSQVTITGFPIDETMPAITAVVIDPLGDTFLLVVEVCLLFEDGSFVCPIDIDLNLEFDLTTGLEFGDAPDPSYPTLLASNGARHFLAASGPTLGPSADSEFDGQPTANADGDDMDGGPDENGVFVFPGPATPPFPPITQGGTLDIRVAPTGTNPLLDAWVDWNGDGDWTDTGEQIFASQAIAGPFTDLPSVNVPVTAAIGDTFMRFRVSTAGGLSTTGLALDGEVEDYKIAIQVSTNLCGNGNQDAGEACDDGAANGSTTCGCQTDCEFGNSGTSCRSPGGICDFEEFCDGVGACPEDEVVPTGTTCRTDAGQCDVAEVCDGVGAICPPDGFESPGTNCEDGNQCTEPDSCDGSGTCASGPPVQTPACIQVGGEIIPIETTSLILAGAQSFSWMIPLVLSGIGIGLFVVTRKSENS